MSTAMSSKRTAVHHETMSGRTLGILGLVAGVVLMVAGAMVNVTVLMAIGFIAFGMSFLYLNSLFWAWMYETGRLRTPSSESIARKYNRYM